MSIHPLAIEFFLLAKQKKRTLRSVALSKRMSPATFTNWKRHSAAPRLPQLEAAFDELGYRIVVRKKRKVKQ